MPLINRVRGAKKLVSIIILTAPTTTTYKYGTAFNPAGMVIQAIYSNGKIETITDYTYSPTGNLTHDTSAITISYTEKKITATVQQEITVTPILYSITVTTMPTKTTYEYGNTFDRTGMIVTATYTDGSTAAVTNYTVTPTSLTTLGTQNMTISYTEDEVSKTANFNITVTRITIANVPSQSNTLTYNGNSQSPTWNNYNSSQLTLSGTTSASNAGEHTVTFTPKANYMWADGTIDAKEVTWTIGKMAVAIPTLSTTTYTYDGNAKTPTQNNYNSTYMTRSGTSSATNAGNYSITYTLKANYKWSDGTETDKTLNWKINKANASIVFNPNTFTFTSKTQIFTGITMTVPDGLDGNDFLYGETWINLLYSDISSNPKIMQLSLNSSSSKIANGTYTCGVTYKGNTNYNEVTGSITVYVALIPEKTKTATSLTARSMLAGGSAGTSYSFFAGGFDGNNSVSNVVEAYNSSLVKSTCTTLAKDNYDMAGGSIGKYAVFAGGVGSYYVSTDVVYSTVYSYNTSRTQGTPTTLSKARYGARAASNGTYLLVAGGRSSGANVTDTVDAYSTTLSRTTPTVLTTTRVGAGVAAAGKYIIVTGGGSNLVDVYNANKTHSVSTSYGHTTSQYLAGASAGNYGLVAGGGSSITVFNNSGTYQTALNSTFTGTNVAGTQLGDSAIFTGGATSTVEIYTSTLTKQTPTTLATTRAQLAAASLGNSAIFAGGNGNNNAYWGSLSNYVEKYE